MKKTRFSRFIWWFWIYLFRMVGLVFRLSPVKLPRHESQKLCNAALGQDVLVIFNPGGWGDISVEQAEDFAPILAGIQETLARLRYRSAVVAYTRTLPGLFGRLAGIREQYNSFRHNSWIMVEDIRCLAASFPQMRFLIAGFSIGGGLTGRTMSHLDNLPNVYGITVGVPGWFYTYASERSLVLNNNNRDPLCVGDSNAIAMAVLKAPFKWWQARKNGHPLSVALAIQVPNHEYFWSSPEVSTPIVQFLEDHFKKPSK